MKLHENQEEFKKLIQLASDELEIRQVYIEKDYWVSYVLKELSQSKFSGDVVFKGGTSLSKAYKIVDRFSEDIDLVLLAKDGMTGGQIKKLITDIEKNITSNTKAILVVHIYGLPVDMNPIIDLCTKYNLYLIR